jgi:hypothetical protein
MPFEQSEKTKDFIESVKRLIDSGEVKNQAAIVETLSWDKTLMSNVMNGRKNVPNDVYRKFAEVYPVAAPQTDADYRDKYIALLEARVKELEAGQATSKGIADRLENIHYDQKYMFSLLVSFQKYWLQMEQKEPAQFRKVLGSIQKTALEDQQTFSQQGKAFFEGTDRNS